MMMTHLLTLATLAILLTTLLTLLTLSSQLVDEVELHAVIRLLVAPLAKRFKYHFTGLQA